MLTIGVKRTFWPAEIIDVRVVQLRPRVLEARNRAYPVPCQHRLERGSENRGLLGSVVSGGRGWIVDQTRICTSIFTSRPSLPACVAACPSPSVTACAAGHSGLWTRHAESLPSGLIQSHGINSHILCHGKGGGCPELAIVGSDDCPRTGVRSGQVAEQNGLPSILVAILSASGVQYRVGVASSAGRSALARQARRTCACLVTRSLQPRHSASRHPCESKMWSTGAATIVGNLSTGTPREPDYVPEVQHPHMLDASRCQINTTTSLLYSCSARPHSRLRHEETIEPTRIRDQQQRLSLGEGRKSHSHGGSALMGCPAGTKSGGLTSAEPAAISIRVSA